MEIDNIFLSKEVLEYMRNKYKVNITYLPKEVENIDYAYCGGNDIYMFTYTSKLIECICLCHEISHSIISERFKGKYIISKLANEGAVWTETINVLKDNEDMFKILFNFDDYNSKEFIFIRKCFDSYISKENI